jgi:hypothetical protein
MSLTDSPRTRVDERRSARGGDRGWRQQVGEEEQRKGKTNGTSDDGENDGARMM